MDNDKITQLKDLLEEAKIQIKAFSLPGLEFGRCVFENNPIIETDALRELEKNYAIEIPADYKLYLTKIGNGGSQPLCGMFSVEESLALNRLSESDMQSLPDTELIKRYKSIYNYDDDDEFYRKDYLSDYELSDDIKDILERNAKDGIKIELYDKDSPYYNDICYSDSKNNKADMILNDRQEDL